MARLERFWLQLGGRLLVGLAFLFLLTRVVIPAAQRPVMRGFAGYYTASILFAQGKLDARGYDNDWFVAQIEAAVGQPVHEVFAPTLPTVSLLALPLTFFPAETARQLWIWINLAVLLAALTLLIRVLARLRPGRSRAGRRQTLIILSLISPAVAANFHEDQALILFFGLLVVVLWGLAGGYERLAGLALGLTFILKTVGLSLWLLLAVRRCWRSLVWGVAVIIIGLALTLPQTGFEIWQAYLEAVLTVTGGAIKAVTAYQTTTGFFTHLFQFDPRWNPAPLADWPIVAEVIPLLVTLLAIASTLWWGRQAPLPLFFAGLVPLSVILLPVAEEHHFIMMLIPLSILIEGPDRDFSAGHRSKRLFSGEMVGIGAVIILLFSPIPYESPALSRGVLALLAYPRLYGGWLLWGLLMRRMAGNRNPAFC